MLAAAGLSAYNFTFDNWSATPSTTPGTSIVPGTSSVEGSWTQVATSGNIARDVYWMQLLVNSGATSAAIKDMALDIGVDNAGGTSYTAVISDILCGDSASITSAPGSQTYLLPFYIKSGSSVAIRVQGGNATPGTVRVAIRFYGDPTNPENVPVGQYSATIGTVASTQGVAFTPGNASFGSYVSLGTTPNDLWWWQLCVQNSSATVGDIRHYVELSYGDATNKVLIQRAMVTTTSTESVVDTAHCNSIWLECYKFVPSGSTIYVRGIAGAAPVAGWNAVAIGIGG